MTIHRPHVTRHHLHRPTDRHCAEFVVYLIALAVMGIAVLIQMGARR